MVRYVTFQAYSLHLLLNFRLFCPITPAIMVSLAALGPPGQLISGHQRSHMVFSPNLLARGDPFDTQIFPSVCC